jgi:hypothetical protein
MVPAGPTAVNLRKRQVNRGSGQEFSVTAEVADGGRQHFDSDR